MIGDVRLGIADHLGWAVAVTASACHTVVDRRRIELISTPLSPADWCPRSPRLPSPTYGVATRGMRALHDLLKVSSIEPLDEARAREAWRASAKRLGRRHDRCLHRDRSGAARRCGLVRAARTLAYSVLAAAADALNAGAPLDRIQGHFVTRAANLLAGAEADAVLASPYGLGFATTARWGEPMATSGERRCPPVGRSDGRSWGETDGR